MFKAPDTNPDVTPTTMPKAGVTWTTIAGILTVILQILNMLPPLPPPWDGILVVVAGAIAGIINRKVNPSYQPKKPQD